MRTAHEVLGYDLGDLEQRELDQTLRAQPALFVASLVAAEALRARDPAAFGTIAYAAGFSLGEVRNDVVCEDWLS